MPYTKTSKAGYPIQILHYRTTIVVVSIYMQAIYSKEFSCTVA